MNEQNFENFWTKTFWWFDLNVWENDDFDEINEHWIDVFFINFDIISNALNAKYEFFDKMTILKINVDLNICVDIAIKICNFDESKKR